MPKYKTQIQFGGPTAPPRDAGTVSIDIGNDGNATDLISAGWTTREGVVASVGFQSDMSAFVGFRQSPGEGPVGYFGQKV